jgi:formamidopyrimidine-DNA glycosylase
MAVGTVTCPDRSFLLPELPEVEITRRHLDASWSGRVMTEVDVSHQRTARFNASPEEVVSLMTGRTVEAVRRHGKFLVVDLDDHHTVVGHLGMSGRFAIVDPGDPREPHTHFVARLDSGQEIRFVDPRTFGFIAVFDEEDLMHSGVGRLGPDAYLAPPSVEELLLGFSGRRAPIKALLLDQRHLAGLGNIYADEALFASSINPLTAGGDIGRDDLQILLDSIAVVLRDAIENGGTTLSDMAYLLPDGRAGENMTRLAVYGRSDHPCDVCETRIERVIVRGRSTHFCPRCQTK